MVLTTKEIGPYIFKIHFNPFLPFSIHFNHFQSTSTILNPPYKNKTNFNPCQPTSINFTHLPTPIYPRNKQPLNFLDVGQLEISTAGHEERNLVCNSFPTLPHTLSRIKLPVFSIFQSLLLYVPFRFMRWSHNW